MSRRIEYQQPVVILLVLVVSSVFVGCNRRDPNIPALAAATGVVTFNGEPLAGATVSFSSTHAGKGYLPGAANTDERGEFKIRTYNLDGAVVGKHKVSIVKIDESSIARDPETGRPYGPPMVHPKWKKPKSFIPTKYTSLEQSGLIADVLASTNNRFEFNLVGKADEETPSTTPTKRKR